MDIGNGTDLIMRLPLALGLYYAIYLFLVLASIASLMLGKIFKIYTDAALPVIDSFTTIFSLFATYMVTKNIGKLDLLDCY